MEWQRPDTITINGQEYKITRLPPGDALYARYAVEITARRRSHNVYSMLQGEHEPTEIYSKGGVRLWPQELYVYLMERHHSLAAMIREVCSPKEWNKLFGVTRKTWLTDFGPDAGLYADRKEYRLHQPKVANESDRGAGEQGDSVEEVGEGE